MRLCIEKDEGLTGHTHITYALNNLKIQLSTTSVPTKKSIIERANGTYQRRLCAELHKAGITTLEEANEYLINKFVSAMNKEFGNKNHVIQVFKDQIFLKKQIKF